MVPMNGAVSEKINPIQSINMLDSLRIIVQNHFISQYTFTSVLDLDLYGTLGWVSSDMECSNCIL